MDNIIEVLTLLMSNPKYIQKKSYFTTDGSQSKVHLTIITQEDITKQFTLTPEAFEKLKYHYHTTCPKGYLI